MAWNRFGKTPNRKWEQEKPEGRYVILEIQTLSDYRPGDRRKRYNVMFFDTFGKITGYLVNDVGDSGSVTAAQKKAATHYKKHFATKNNPDYSHLIYTDRAYAQAWLKNAKAQLREAEKRKDNARLPAERKLMTVAAKHLRKEIKRIEGLWKNPKKNPRSIPAKWKGYPKLFKLQKLADRINNKDTIAQGKAHLYLVAAVGNKVLYKHPASLYRYLKEQLPYVAPRVRVPLNDALDEARKIDKAAKGAKYRPILRAY